MKYLKGVRTWLVVIPALTGLILFGLTGAMGQPAIAGTPKEFSCVASDKLETDVAPEAELAELTCSFKRWEGVETLHFTVGVKNVTDAPKRYRVNIFLENGKAVGGLIPRKTKAGLVEPGQTQSFTYPVKDMTEKPEGIILLVKTIGE